MITNKIKVWGLLGLPLLAIAIAVMVFAFNPTTDTRTTEAGERRTDVSVSPASLSSEAAAYSSSVRPALPDAGLTG